MTVKDANSIETVFASAFKRHGQLWRIEDVDPKGISSGAYFIRLCRALAPDVNTHFIANKSFNAFGTTCSGVDFIGLYVGAVEILHSCSAHLLASRDCLTGIGNASVERANAEGINICEPFPGFPIDPTRAKAAKDFAFCACLGLFCHELAHVELCHVPFVSEHFGLDEHVELNVVATSAEQALLFRALEWDADMSGALGSTRVWKRFYEDMELSYLDSMGWGRVWITSMHMLYWIMHLVQPQHRSRELSTHSLPFFRLISITEAAELHGGIPKELTLEQIDHDTIALWLMAQFKTRNEHLILPSSAEVEAEHEALSGQYSKIADRLEELQDERSQRTGRPIERPDYPGRGWGKQWRPGLAEPGWASRWYPQ